MMMAALDDELSSRERAELQRLLAQDAGLREEWDRLRKVKEATGEMKYVEPPDEVWDDYWVSVYNRLERGVGWVLISLGSLVLIGWAAWHAIGAMLADSDLPGFIKVAVFVVVMGAVILLFSVIREKLFTRRSDRYKGVQR
jgi:ferric-dicitrate binding protein FerR (iron transport regulator)